MANEGFRGMGVRHGEAYNFSAKVREVCGAPVLRVELYSANGSLLDSVRLREFSSDWGDISVRLHLKRTDAKATLHVLVEGHGAVDIDMVSLFRGGNARWDGLFLGDAFKPALQHPGVPAGGH